MSYLLNAEAARIGAERATLPNVRARAAQAVERWSDGSWSVPPDYLDQALEYEKGAARAAPVRPLGCRQY